MKYYLRYIAILLSLSAPLSANAQLANSQSSTMLALFGGDEYPDAAIDELAEAAGNENAVVLDIAWASDEPQPYFEYLKTTFQKYGVKNFIPSLARPEPGKEKEFRDDFLQNKLPRATLVMITGGKQPNLLSVLQDREIYEAIRNKFFSGTPFGVKSAGENLVGELTLTGEGSETAEGLNFLHDTITDSHFIKRDHQERLKTALRKTGMQFGIGPDAGSVVMIKNLKTATVYGPADTMFYHQVGQEIEESRLSNNQALDLKTWKPIDCNFTFH